MTGLADKLGKISQEDVSAAAEKVKTAQISADRERDKQIELLRLQNQKQTAQVRLDTLANFIEFYYVKPLQGMGLVAFSSRQGIEPIHLHPQQAAAAEPGFSAEGCYMLPMFFRGGDAEKHSPPSLDYSDSFSLELGCNVSGGSDHVKISIWMWDGRQKYMRDPAIKCLAPVPDGAVTVKLANEYDLPALHLPLVEALSRWLEAFAARDSLMKTRLAEVNVATLPPSEDSVKEKDSVSQQQDGTL